MKKSIVLVATLSASLLVGCQSKEEKLYYQKQAELLEKQIETIESTEEYLEDVKKQIEEQNNSEEYYNQYDSITPNLSNMTVEDIEKLYGKDNITYDTSGTYLEKCPICGGKYTCIENSECSLEHNF